MYLLFYPNWKTSTNFNLTFRYEIEHKILLSSSPVLLRVQAKGTVDWRMDELIIGDPQRCECAWRQNTVPSTVTHRPKTKHRTHYDRIIWFAVFRGQLQMRGITWRSHWEWRLHSSAVWRCEVWKKFTWQCVLWYKFTWHIAVITEVYVTPYSMTKIYVMPCSKI